jgi:hypothetical protein
MVTAVSPCGLSGPCGQRRCYHLRRHSERPPRDENVVGPWRAGADGGGAGGRSPASPAGRIVSRSPDAAGQDRGWPGPQGPSEAAAAPARGAVSWSWAAASPVWPRPAPCGGGAWRRRWWSARRRGRAGGGAAPGEPHAAAGLPPRGGRAPAPRRGGPAARCGPSSGTPGSTPRPSPPSRPPPSAGRIRARRHPLVARRGLDLQTGPWTPSRVTNKVAAGCCKSRSRRGTLPVDLGGPDRRLDAGRA